MRIFNVSGKVEGVMESYDRIEYTHDFYGQDTFILTINKNAVGADLLVHPNIIEYDNFGIKHYCLIEDIISMKDEQEMLTISGRTYGLFDHRIILGLDEHQAQAETVMHYYLAKLTGVREVPNLVLETNQARGSVIKYPGNNQYYSEMLKEISIQNGTGWDVILSNGQWLFTYKEGTDRTLRDAKGVIFSYNFGNIRNSKWEYIRSKSKNVAYVGDDQAGALRALDMIGVAIGIDRREIFVNGRNTDANGRTFIGEQVLEQYKDDYCIEAEYNYLEPFKYGRDFFVGDKVVYDTGDFVVSQQILKSIETKTRTGTTVKFIVNKNKLDFNDILRTNLARSDMEARR